MVAAGAENIFFFFFVRSFSTILHWPTYSSVNDGINVCATSTLDRFRLFHFLRKILTLEFVVLHRLMESNSINSTRFEMDTDAAEVASGISHQKSIQHNGNLKIHFIKCFSRIKLCIAGA